MLRNKEELENIPNDRPGWYRWWAREPEVMTLLDSKFLTQKYFNKLSAKLHKGDGELNNYCYIYTGVAIKESIRSRLNWHINQPHTESAVEYGTLSTLRQSLSSLVAGNQRNEEATNNFIDTLIVEYFPVEFQIKDLEAKEYLESNEKLEMDKYILILNIQKNKRREIKDLKKELSKLRTSSKRKEMPAGPLVNTLIP
jgi:Uri superfamily endonuclease